MIDRIPEIDVRRSPKSAEVVDEVGESRETATRREREGSALIEWRMLLRHLTQVLASKTEAVRAPDLCHRFLEEVVVGDSELRDVRCNSSCRKAVYSDVRQRLCKIAGG